MFFFRFNSLSLKFFSLNFFGFYFFIFDFFIFYSSILDFFSFDFLILNAFQFGSYCSIFSALIFCVSFFSVLTRIDPQPRTPGWAAERAKISHSRSRQVGRECQVVVCHFWLDISTLLI